MDLLGKFEHVASCRADRAFVHLLFAQWAGLVLIALWLSVRSPHGTEARVHWNLLLAFAGGGVLALFPARLSRVLPGTWQTRHVIAIAQMLTSPLLIAISGGRMESHFHVFASLAFLAFYLDWTVMLTASAVAAIDHLLRGMFWPQSILEVSYSSQWRWVEHAGWVILTDLLLIWSAVERRRDLRTVAQQQLNTEALLERAHTDVLTGLPNRLSFQRWMEEHLNQRRETREPFALMYIDLDRFKEINDRLGHAAGDTVLREVADRLSRSLGSQCLLSRVGGDEFIATFSTVPPREQLVSIAQEITSILMLPFYYESEELYLGASVGISCFPEHGESEEELVQRADEAMYRVKQKGRRGFAFCDTPSTRSAVALLEKDLQHAIENEELELHFQPLVDLSSSVIAFEALVRWRSPRRGLVPPNDFISAAETSGQIVALGRLVLRKAIEQAAEWRRQGLNFGHITVNVSPQQLAESDFVSRLEQMLSVQDVPASAICLECTESACASNTEVQERLQELHSRGIRIYVDDFGTGYSSLSRLQEMSFDVIKIDKLFIQRLTTSETGSEIVALMISFAHLLGMTVVAEGVETAEQFQALQALGCDHIQGYYVARPMQTSDATQFLRQRQLPREITTAVQQGAGESNDSSSEKAETRADEQKSLNRTAAFDNRAWPGLFRLDPASVNG